MTQQYDNVYAEASQGQTVLNQGLYETSSTQKYDLGHIFRTNDGRTFVYAKNGSTALTAGQVLQAMAGAYTYDTVSELTLASAVAVGDTSMTITPTTTIQNAFGTSSTDPLATNTLADGFAWVASTTLNGTGNMYKIKSHAAGSASVADITLNLHDPIRVADSTAASAIGVMPSLYRNVEDANKTLTGKTVGVAPIAVTASYYFWMQTYGPAVVQLDAPDTYDLITNGEMLGISATAAGAVQAAYIPAGATSAIGKLVPVVGQAIGTVTTTDNEDFIPVFLTIQA